ncbi:MAG TPA: ABC transporter ATP-binding protein, partial [Vicinamibacterales bacterium]|nr:ABC transporter ATP-binding protein [Vicinamibacterales bacterium]
RGAAMNGVMLELDGLVRHFDDVRAVDGVSFSVERGMVLGFIGPNGAGKTTTMRILATLDTPQHGDARVGGYSVVEQPEDVRRITGFMPDYAGVYANMTVTEYLDFFARAYDLRGTERRKAVESIIEFMGIGELSDRLVESLSKGLKQRVALGRAIVHNPDLLILDEPAANLDPRARIEFRTLIRELAADGKTILLSSHILGELSEMCDSVAVIEHGKILATGTVREILKGLRRRRILSVRLAGTHDGLERFLLEQPDILNVHEAGGWVQFEFAGGDAEQVSLISGLIAAGFPVLEFSARNAGLEDLFIEITEGRVQ